MYKATAREQRRYSEWRAASLLHHSATTKKSAGTCYLTDTGFDGRTSPTKESVSLFYIRLAVTKQPFRLDTCVHVHVVDTLLGLSTFAV